MMRKMHLNNAQIIDLIEHRSILGVYFEVGNHDFIVVLGRLGKLKLYIVQTIDKIEVIKVLSIL